MTGQAQQSGAPVGRHRKNAQGREQPVVVALVLQYLLHSEQDVGHGLPGQHHGPPRHPQADPQRGLVRAAAADVTDEGVQPPVRRLDQVIEVATQLHLAAARLVPGGHGQPRVGDERRRQQPPRQPGVLPGQHLGEVQLKLRLLGLPALHRVPDDPVQQRLVDVALDQVILRARPDRGRAEELIGPAGEHHDGGVGDVLPQPPNAVQITGVRQPQIEQHAGSAGQKRPRLSQRPGPLNLHSRCLLQQLLHNQRIPVVVLDQQDTDPRRRLQARGTSAWQVLIHHSSPILYMTSPQ